MERLTEKHWRNLDPWGCCGQDYYCKRGCHEEGGCTKGCIVPKIYARLAAYEDTGLEPCDYNVINAATEQVEKAGEDLSKVNQAIGSIGIDRLNELVQADRDGRLVVLPCKVGDTVWTKMERFGPNVYEAKVVKIKPVRFSDSSLFFFADIEFNIRDPYYDDGRLMLCGASVVINDEFGSWDIAYLTREEADAAPTKRK